jgi:thiol-disulfide isomerase/thioredoxin
MTTYCSRALLACGLAAVTALDLPGCGGKAPATTTPAPAPAAASAPAPAVTPPPAPTGAPAASPAAAPDAAARPARPQTPPPLTGQVTRAALLNYAGWEQLRAEDYTPDAAAVASIKEQCQDVEALLFVASWCPDSKRDVPRLFKILDQAGFPESRVTMHALDRTKKDAAGLTVQWNIERVPTFIFLRGGKEVGRIVERPKATLESDLLHLLGPK